MPNMNVDVHRLIDRYHRRREEREPRLRAFLESPAPGFLVVQSPSSCLWGACNNIDMIVDNNLRFLEESLAFEWSDDLPYMEPWIGTGLYANAFGSEYVFRTHDAPHTEYRYHRMEELAPVKYPDWRESPIMRMTLDCIDALKEATDGEIPMSTGDTQSPFDTASLVLDACATFAACLQDPRTLRRFFRKIADLVIEFTKVQIEHIGPDLAVMPGHQFPSLPHICGLLVSDDNLAVASPAVNRSLALPADALIGQAFDGLVIHSCGNWTQTMKDVAAMPEVVGIECAVGRPGEHRTDPHPNDPAAVAEALDGSTVILKARFVPDIDRALEDIKTVADPGRRIIVELPFAPEHAEENYRRTTEVLEGVY